MIPKELNCFFLKIQRGKNVFLDRYFMPLDASHFSGIYAFVSYNAPSLLAISELTEYGSQHGGLDAMVHVLKLHSLRVKQHLFSTNMPFFLPKREPLAGGEICLAQGEIMWWNVKSDLFSRPKEYLHDDSPLLTGSISKIGLLADRFISIEKSVEFENRALRILCHPNGQFKDKQMHLVLKHMTFKNHDMILEI